MWEESYILEVLRVYLTFRKKRNRNTLVCGYKKNATFQQKPKQEMFLPPLGPLVELLGVLGHLTPHVGRRRGPLVHLQVVHRLADLLLGNKNESGGITRCW